ncbi:MULTISPECIES: ScbR family autoregulator-binding transcription factor [unclassified Streptomyces]|uniref:ScbR family autoregulator-binding transcription factor n=1 Tax=unclassified Streptomyces TaxID=2593676 RepID=UPI00234BC60B|nr:ScbR family autoregulator-binding transcription factor [Streptomyces sp. M92]WCN03772.1 TetR/AcrR family transcriptional regulator [Streptomyces sp. M92]
MSDHSDTAQTSHISTNTSADDTSHLKQERAIRTRRTILDAAAEVFARHGYPNVTIKDIADGAEMTKGAVYFHFSNKEALAVAVTDEFYRRLNEIVSPALEGDHSSPSTVADVLLRTAGGFRDDVYVKAGARLQIERPYIKAEMPVPYVGFTSLVVELLEKCRAAGRLPKSAAPEALGRALVSALFGAQHISWVQNNRTDIVERVEEIIDAFGLLSAPAR